jgi:hypothetical protein
MQPRCKTSKVTYLWQYCLRQLEIATDTSIRATGSSLLPFTSFELKFSQPPVQGTRLHGTYEHRKVQGTRDTITHLRRIFGTPVVGLDFQSSAFGRPPDTWRSVVVWLAIKSHATSENKSLKCIHDGIIYSGMPQAGAWPMNVIALRWPFWALINHHQ